MATHPASQSGPTVASSRPRSSGSRIKQDTINEFSNIVPKWQSTHNQSFNVIKQTSHSVNDRLITEDLTPCIYSKALHRHIHFVAGL
jgi:hypothetical protein